MSTQPNLARLIAAFALIAALAPTGVPAGEVDSPLADPAYDWSRADQVASECFAELLPLVQKQPSVEIVRALGRLCLPKKLAPEESAIIALTEIQANDAGPIGLEAAAVLAQLGNPAATEALQAYVKGKTEWTLSGKLTALELLGVAEDETVSRALASGDSALVVQALHLLRVVGDPAAMAKLKPFLAATDRATRLGAACASYALTADEASLDLLTQAVPGATADELLAIGEAHALASERAEPLLPTMRARSEALRTGDLLLKRNEPRAWAVGSRLLASLGVRSRLPAVAARIPAAPPAERAHLLVSIIQMARLFGTDQAPGSFIHAADAFAGDAYDMLVFAGSAAEKERLGRIEIEHLILGLCRYGGAKNVFALLGKDAAEIEARAAADLKARKPEGACVEFKPEDIAKGRFAETPRFKEWRLATLRSRTDGTKPDLCDVLAQIIAFEARHEGGVLTQSGIKADDVVTLREKLRQPEKP